jgi:hypothetical protein
MEGGDSDRKGVGAYISSDVMDCKNGTTEHHHQGWYNRLQCQWTHPTATADMHKRLRYQGTRFHP